jgi:hypothetical protein
VPARVGRGQHEVLIGLLADLHGLHHQLAAGLVASPGTTFVEHECGVDQIAAVLGQPLRAVERAGGFLTAGQRQLERALGFVFLAGEADQRIGPDRRLGLVVIAAAGVEIAVLFDQREGIALPVCAFCLNHIDMREQQHRLQLAIGAGVDHHQHALLGVTVRLEQHQLVAGNARGAQPVKHPLGGQRAIAFGQRGVGFDQLLVEFAELRLIGAQRLRGGRVRRQQRGSCGNSRNAHRNYSSKALRSVEDLFQPVLVALVGLVAMTIAGLLRIALLGHLLRRRRGLILSRGRGLGGGTLDDLVELAAIEPDPAAIGAIVDFDPLALTHHQGHGCAGGTFHGGSFSWGWGQPCCPDYAANRSNGQTSIACGKARFRARLCLGKGE